MKVTLRLVYCPFPQRLPVPSTTNAKPNPPTAPVTPYAVATLLMSLRVTTATPITRNTAG